MDCIIVDRCSEFDGGVNFGDLYRRAANYVDIILKGR